MNDETEVATVTPQSNTAIKVGLKQVSKFATTLITVFAEAAVVGFIGAQIGAYFSARAIVNDCSTVAMAKAGDHYLHCSIVPPKKDPENAPPR